MQDFCERVRGAFLQQQAPGSTPAQVKDAAIWLEDFQGTREAWAVSDQLLAQPVYETVGAGPQVFAAQTMRTKIQFDWAELPADSQISLRTSLIAHLVRFRNGPQPVLTQLCLSICMLTLQMQAWHTAVNDLVVALTQPPEDAADKLPCLLELLTVLPEEAHSTKVPLAIAAFASKPDDGHLRRLECYRKDATSSKAC